MRLVLLFMILSPALNAQQDALLQKIWDGVQDAQKKFSSGCGHITETRTSKLLVKPMVFRGKFCTEGMTRFWLEYAEPDRIKIVFNQDYLNVTTGKNTEVIEVGGNVRRTQAYFSKENSIENLKKNFTIEAREDGRLYQLKLVPRNERFSRRLNFIIVKLSKDNLLLRSLEVDGASGVNSVFAIDMDSTNTKVPESLFHVYRPKKSMQRDDIEKIIPHREPFLWIDRVEELEPGVRCVAFKRIDPELAAFAGHFPSRPILPGIFLIEAVAQTAGVMLGSAAEASAGVALLAAVNRFKFLRPVAPGEELRIETKKLTDAGTMAYIEGTVSVEGQIVARGELSVVAA